MNRSTGATAGPVLESNNTDSSLSKPWVRLTYDIVCGIVISFMIAAKIFTFAVLIFQGEHTQDLRPIAVDAASIGVIIVSVIMLTWSRYPFIIIVPDMFIAPFLMKMNQTLESSISSPEELKVTTLALILVLICASGVLHVTMSALRLLRFAEFLPYCVFCGLFSAIGMLFIQR